MLYENCRPAVLPPAANPRYNLAGWIDSSRKPFFTGPLQAMSKNNIVRKVKTYAYFITYFDDVSFRLILPQ